MLRLLKMNCVEILNFLKKGLQLSLQIDGIDLDIEDGGTSAQLQIHVLKSCREKLGPDFLIT